MDVRPGNFFPNIESRNGEKEIFEILDFLIWNSAPPDPNEGNPNLELVYFTVVMLCLTKIDNYELIRVSH